ncbi:MAG: hypothetical protein J0H17_21470 [Rhizobiales bacterium]|nr:hypothetical protein [Hyphomicrobiales bacterium]
MPNTPRSALWACGFGAALVLGALSPASAAPVAALAGASAASDTAAIQVAQKKHRHYRHRRHRAGGGHYEFDRGWRGRYHDNVGSVGQDGYGYGYNRFSGQRYQSCVFDEGYGRTRPCDAGGGGGSGRN